MLESKRLRKESTIVPSNCEILSLDPPQMESLYRTQLQYWNDLDEDEEALEDVDRAAQRSRANVHAAIRALFSRHPCSIDVCWRWYVRKLRWRPEISRTFECLDSIGCVYCSFLLSLLFPRLFLHAAPFRWPGMYPSNVRLTKYRAPHALHKIGFSGGPLRQQGVTVT